VVRRSLSIAAALAAALVVAAPALAVRVHVRVEGVRTTIFGGGEPWARPVVGTIAPPAGPDVTVSTPTPFGALERASRRGEFFYRVEPSSFGPYVAQVGRYGGSGSSGWAYKVNGVSPPVAATDVTLKDGDHVLWYYATFGPSGGPKTLVLRKTRRPALCFKAFAQDDAGVETAVGDVVFRVSRVPVRSASGEYCPKKRIYSIRVAKAGGFVRSAVLAGDRAR
jgi:hypothetical protein